MENEISLQQKIDLMAISVKINNADNVGDVIKNYNLLLATITTQVKP